MKTSSVTPMGTFEATSAFVGDVYVSASLDGPGQVMVAGFCDSAYLTADEAVDLALALLVSAKEAKANARKVGK